MATVKELRQEMRLSQLDLASRAKVGIQTIWRIEQGYPVLPITAEAVARALNKRVTDLSDIILYKRVG